MAAWNETNRCDPQVNERSIPLEDLVADLHLFFVEELRLLSFRSLRLPLLAEGAGPIHSFIGRKGRVGRTGRSSHGILEARPSSVRFSLL